jgi:hypothetical protein
VVSAIIDALRFMRVVAGFLAELLVGLKGTLLLVSLLIVSVGAIGANIALRHNDEEKLRERQQNKSPAATH